MTGHPHIVAGHSHAAPPSSQAPRSAPRWQTVATFSRGLAKLPGLTDFLQATHILLHPTPAQASNIEAIIGWGQKPNTVAAQRYAATHNIPYWRAEDGFLRSVGLGISGEPPLSLVLDNQGIYYDARSASDLESLLNNDTAQLDDPILLDRARRAMTRIVDAKLSKYNDAPPQSDPWPETSKQRVLVIDQTFGDMSVSCGLADEKTFAAMFQAAIDENTDAEIIVKAHPDVVRGKKRGYLSQRKTRLGDQLVDQGGGQRNITFLAQSLNPIQLLEQVDRVYTVTSQLGFEALLLGKKVTCFGAPFYAGWGLTDDRYPIPRRVQSRTLEQVFAAAYILYPQYIDPDTRTSCELERVIDHLALQRTHFVNNRGRIFCFGFHRHFWKRNYVRLYLRSPDGDVRFPLTVGRARRDGFNSSDRILVWGQRCSDAVRALAAQYNVPIWRMEDGFLRSVGLGSDLTVPASLVVDPLGIYYDPTAPSELEKILQNETFSPEALVRARALRTQIITNKLSKYNVGNQVPVPVPKGKRILLVPGQVEDDASIRLGCRDICTNLGLLEQVRNSNPDAFIIYKPHPDVVRGNRAQRTPNHKAHALCDHFEETGSLAYCLAVADEVHTLTSLVGFEALLRDIPVFVYGQPFYSGWGLTTDRHPISRRTRQLHIDELVVGVLIRYPRYINHKTSQFTTPEATIAYLCEQRKLHPTVRLKTSWPRRQFRKLANAYKGLIHHAP